MQHTAVNVVIAFQAPSNSWNFYKKSHSSFRSVSLSL